MNDYDALNAYLQLLYGDSFSFFRRLFQDYRHFVYMQEWFSNNNIYIPFIHDMNSENFMLCKKTKSLDDISAVVKQDCRKQLAIIREIEKRKYHVIFVHGIENRDSFNKRFINEEWIQRFARNNCHLYWSRHIYGKAELSFKEPHDAFLDALYQIEKWPGLVVIKNGQYRFFKTNTIEAVENVFIDIDLKRVFKKEINVDDDMYLIHLSDLHLGPKKKNTGKEVLESSLDLLYKHLQTKRKLQFFITGDLMNSPNRKSMYEASSFINLLKRKYKADVSFVLGNHDVIVKGFNLFKRQRAKVIAYLLGGNVRIKEKEKMICIELNSTVEGNLARGKIGKEQLQQIDEELSKIDGIEEYTKLVLVHHHVVSIPKDHFLQKKWYENIFIGRWIDHGKVLLDAKQLVEWFKKHKIHYVFHGHKHLPFFNYHEGIYVIACGSSCGGGASERKSRYLSYNIVKYDVLSQQMKYCIICYEDTTHIGRKRIKVHLFQDGFYEVSSKVLD